MFELDLQSLALVSSNPFFSFWLIFKNGGWIAVLLALLWGFKQLWIYEIQNRWVSKLKFVLLAIDVPDLLEPNLKAVESIFHQVAGIHKMPNLIEKYWDGWFQESISFEIVSRGGNVQYFIRAPEYYRDLVESAIYAQYPTAEINLVDDYVNDIPAIYPDPNFNFWGTQFVLVKPPAYPIKTHPNFEYALSQKFADPMAALLEIFNRLRAGEEAWFQVTIKPTPDEKWKTEAELIMKKLAGTKVKSAQTAFDKVIAFPMNILGTFYDLLVPGSPMADKKVEKADLPSMMLHLTPAEKDIIEAIGRKTEKQGFITKVRLIYLAHHQSVFSKATRVGAMVGAIKQFNTQNLNAFKPDGNVTTRANYFFVKYRIAQRQIKLMRAYRYRSTWAGATASLLNTEELATLWHFPTEEVKTPLVKRAASKKVVPPTDLPEQMPIDEEPVELPAPMPIAPTISASPPDHPAPSSPNPVSSSAHPPTRTPSTSTETEIEPPPDLPIV